MPQAREPTESMKETELQKNKKSRKIPDDEIQNWVIIESFKYFDATRNAVREHMNILEQIDEMPETIRSTESNTAFEKQKHPNTFDEVEEATS